MFVPDNEEVSYGGLNMINALDVSDEFISNQKPTPSPTPGPTFGLEGNSRLASCKSLVMKYIAEF